MLNNFDPDICPICFTKMNAKFEYYKVCFNIPIQNMGPIELGHVAISVKGAKFPPSQEGSLPCEEIYVGNFRLNFYEDRLGIANTKSCDYFSFKDSPLTYQDLDSVEKIEEVIQNYKLLK